ncbi:MAG TPA: preprotein translocase subunit SecG, partial [Actinocrinis sp.]|nr:preprotein translocase subunit SecG [Actinocrinis sp.]
SLLLIVFVLLHKGKGGGLSDMFGGGFTSQHGGSSVVEKNLDRITIVLAVIWLAAIIALGITYKP